MKQEIEEDNRSTATIIRNKIEENLKSSSTPRVISRTLCNSFRQIVIRGTEMSKNFEKIIEKIFRTKTFGKIVLNCMNEPCMHYVFGEKLNFQQFFSMFTLINYPNEEHVLDYANACFNMHGKKQQQQELASLSKDEEKPLLGFYRGSPKFSSSPEQHHFTDLMKNKERQEELAQKYECEVAHL